MAITTRYINFSFNNNESITSAFISIPHKVKVIHIKSGAYMPSVAPSSGSAEYIPIFSDLTENQPIGIFYDDNTYSSATIQDIYYHFNTPVYVQGTYTFSRALLNKVAVSTPQADIGVIIEFYENDA